MYLPMARAGGLFTGAVVYFLFSSGLCSRYWNGVQPCHVRLYVHLPFQETSETIQLVLVRAW